jgi:hypothetical protein
MSAEMRLIFQYAGNLLGCGFVTVMVFLQLASFVIEKKAKHIVSCLAWITFLSVLILRTAAIPKPPLLNPQTIADGIAIGWACTLLLGIVWGVFHLMDRRKEHAARKKIVEEGHLEY